LKLKCTELDVGASQDPELDFRCLLLREGKGRGEDIGEGRAEGNELRKGRKGMR